MARPLKVPASIDALDARARKGRGAISNPPVRYDSQSTVAVDDGWGSADERDPLKVNPHPDDDEPPRLATTLTRDASRTVIARNTSPDVPFDRSINPYRGCEHGCVYCFARPTHAYLGLSPGLDFETKLLFKPDAPELLRQELARRSYRCDVIAMGTNTDPYQPVERDLKLMRRILQVLAEFNHPVGIVTKNALVTRDIDILAPMARRNLVQVFLSVTTLDRHLANIMEPRASTPTRRVAAIRALNQAGVPCGVMAAPMIPAINDHEMEAILEAAHQAGAQRAGYTVLRLPLEIAQLFEEWLREHFPDRAERVLSLVRQMRGGKIYDSEWGQRMTGTGTLAQLIRQRFDLAAKKFGFNKFRYQLDTTQFRVPESMSGKDTRQMSLF
ncbi:MAG: PA0069 family radical SAM protein [Alphaproteobacteria bacterium]|nr:PA0069 family radical SAM protein [Alphaproteobacteria bacterium]MCW5741936.1 PA0069 family radical SAM protein [Alphaproteobacteria bacterium]